MQFMMISNDQKEDVLLKEDAFKRNQSRGYNANVVTCVKAELERKLQVTRVQVGKEHY